MKPLHHFYAQVAFINLTLLGLLVMLIWQMLEVASSTLPLGLSLSIATLIPYALKHFFKGMVLDMTVFFRGQLVLNAFLIALVIFAPLNAYTLIAFSIGLGMSNFLRTGCTMSENAHWVMQKSITAQEASRYFQGAVQSGAFCGSFVGAFLIEAYGFVIAVLLLLGVFSLLLVLGLVGYKPHHIDHPTTSEHQDTKAPRVLYGYLGVIALVALHIGAFNMVIPVIYQQVQEWSALSFGLASGIAGIGALVATLPKRHVYLGLVALGILGADVLATNLPMMWLAIGSCFFIGFGNNFIRIAMQEELLHLSHTKALASAIGAKASLYENLAMALAPILTSVLMTYAIGDARLYGVILIGIAVGILVGVWWVKPQNKDTLKEA